MRLELSRRAETDLADIRDYSVEQFGVERTIRYLDAIEQAFRRIIAYPEIGGMHPTVVPAVRSFACQRIFYTVTGAAIRIERVLHQAMDVDRQL